LGNEFEGKVAIVTGAAGGIGRVILTRLAQEGAKCILADINDDWGESTAAALRSRHFDVTYIRTDVRHSDQVNAMVERAVETYRREPAYPTGTGRPNRVDRFHVRQQRAPEGGRSRCLQGWRDPVSTCDGIGTW
jgi:NAD(P)-dependent dehydrogenase (short-subunit alcohol dehydrogenase family)